MINDEGAQKKKLTIRQQLGRFGLLLLVIWFLAALVKPSPPTNPQNTFNDYKNLGLVSSGITQRELMDVGRERSQKQGEYTRP